MVSSSPVYFGADVVADLVDKIPEMITDALTVSGNMLSALGFAMLLSTMLSKNYILTLFWILYCCLFRSFTNWRDNFAALIAFVMDQVKYGKEKRRMVNGK